MSDDNSTAILTEDDLFEGDLEKANEKVRAAIEKAVADALKKAGNEKPQNGAENDGTKPEETFTREQLDNLDATTLDYEIFKSDDADIKEMATTLLEKELRQYKDGATRTEVNGAAEKVSAKLSKLIAGKEGQQPGGEGQLNGPVPMNTSGAAAAHITDDAPKSIDEAEELANKIAAGFKG